MTILVIVSSFYKKETILAETTSSYKKTILSITPAVCKKFV